ncbi:hypothetical protein HaLaN_28328 [Haematococcus lacustris]|uniref:Uncharacterized protein n=1 Tax=Haematococcus lacustris TaxID=44745 RepID=A0A6A0AA92_HAELA|nr:hypothetical protein HaLaN_28328 [Haematococcus lacustris]
MSLGYGQLSQGHGGGMGYLMPCMTANQHIGPQSLNHALSGASVGSARTVASVGSTTPSKPNTVKVLLTYGGSSTTSVTGGWEYTGGETRLLGGLQTEISYTDLVARVANEVHMKLGVETDIEA